MKEIEDRYTSADSRDTEVTALRAQLTAALAALRLAKEEMLQEPCIHPGPQSWCTWCQALAAIDAVLAETKP